MLIYVLDSAAVCDFLDLADDVIESAGDDVHTPFHTAVFRCSPTVFSDKAGRMTVVHHDQRMELVGQIADGFQIGDNAVH